MWKTVAKPQKMAEPICENGWKRADHTVRFRLQVLDKTTLLNVQRRFGNQYETTDRWCRCVANPFRRRLSGKRAKAGLLTCPNSPRLPVRLANSGQWGEYRLWVRRDSQQRELLPIYTAFPFNPLITLFFGEPLRDKSALFFRQNQMSSNSGVDLSRGSRIRNSKIAYGKIWAVFPVVCCSWETVFCPTQPVISIPFTWTVLSLQ